MKVGVTYSNPEKLESYCVALRAAGLDPVPLRAGEPATIDGLSGLVISGGPDLDPALYGETPNGSQEWDSRRDEMEMKLLGDALERDLPVLGICRGLQLFNVYHRGTLHQHLESADLHRQKQAYDAHSVTVAKGTRLAAAMGEGTHSINSRHHQGVKKPGEGLVVSARAADGIVEGLERPDKRWAIAVQWHPEDRVHLSAADQRLLEAFARAVSGRG